MEQEPYIEGWDGYLVGHLNCSCGGKAHFQAFEKRRLVRCAKCGTVYTVRYSVTASLPSTEGEQEERTWRLA